MPEQKELEQAPATTSRRVEGLMAWVRMLLPVAIAAIGWYVGHTVGGINDKIVKLEQGLAGQVIECATSTSRNTVKFDNIQQRLDSIDASNIRSHSNLIQKDDYLRDKAHIDDDIKKLEERHTN